MIANSATSRIVGEDRRTIIGKRATDLLPSVFQAASVGQVEKIEAGVEVHVEETLFDRSHGVARVYDSRKVPLRGPDGEIRGAVGISRDITGRKATDEALRVSEEKARSSALLLQRILEATPASIWVLDRDGRYLLINADSGRILGIDNEAAVGKTLEDMLPADLAHIVRGELEQVLRGEDIIVEEQLFDAALGEVRVFDSRKVPLRDADGQIIGLVGVARDITERKAVELRLQAIVDTAVDAIVVIDETGCIASANPATFTLFGYTEAEMVGRNVAMLMPPGDADSHDRYIDNYMETGQRRIIGVGRQVMGLRKNGTSFPLDLSIAEWFDTNGRRHFTGIMRDVTARLEADAKLRRAQDTLIGVSRLSAAGAMASTLAHELNQPLTASSNLLRSARRLLERNDDTDKVPALLAEAATEVLRAGSIIRRMREYTVNGELEPAPHRLVDLVQTALTMVQRRPETQGVVIDWQLDPAVDRVMADPIQIEQVIVNLLRNAVEAMDGEAERRITIETERNGDHAALHVHDSGHGIPPEQMDRLFQPFATTKDSGTGLGLAICRTIVEAHGGQIHASNRRDGRGATFTITLPVARKVRSRAAEVRA
jgi:two-component system, LuxR family, sensor kinase FixL